MKRMMFYNARDTPGFFYVSHSAPDPTANLKIKS